VVGTQYYHLLAVGSLAYLIRREVGSEDILATVKMSRQQARMPINYLIHKFNKQLE